jgi:hypothetical protein
MDTAVKIPPQSGSFLDAARELSALGGLGTPSTQDTQNSQSNQSNQNTHPERMKRLRTRFLAVLVACCAGLGSWIVYLAFSMPTGYQAKAWSAAWVGFDTLLLLALAGTVVAAMLRRQIVVMLAVFTATLLLCDAWFDIVLDWGTSDVWVSLASAAFIEVPLALFLLSRVRKLVRVALQRRWRELGLPGDPPALHRIPLFFAGETAEPAASEATLCD